MGRLLRGSVRKTLANLRAPRGRELACRRNVYQGSRSISEISGTRKVSKASPRVAVGNLCWSAGKSRAGSPGSGRYFRAGGGN